MFRSQVYVKRIKTNTQRETNRKCGGAEGVAEIVLLWDSPPLKPAIPHNNSNFNIHEFGKWVFKLGDWPQFILNWVSFTYNEVGVFMGSGSRKCGLCNNFFLRPKYNNGVLFLWLINHDVGTFLKWFSV